MEADSVFDCFFDFILTERERLRVFVVVCNIPQIDGEERVTLRRVVIKVKLDKLVSVDEFDRAIGEVNVDKSVLASSGIKARPLIERLRIFVRSELFSDII